MAGGLRWHGCPGRAVNKDVRRHASFESTASSKLTARIAQRRIGADAAGAARSLVDRITRIAAFDDIARYPLRLVPRHAGSPGSILPPDGHAPLPPAVGTGRPKAGNRLAPAPPGASGHSSTGPG